MEELFYNDDLRKYIFSFLRKKPKKKCYDCNKVCVWDYKVLDYVDCNLNPFTFIIDENNPKVTYCIECWSNHVPICSIT